jgi:hypothetical protein
MRSGTSRAGAHGASPSRIPVSPCGLDGKPWERNGWRITPDFSSCMKDRFWGVGVGETLGKAEHMEIS